MQLGVDVGRRTVTVAAVEDEAIRAVASGPVAPDGLQAVVAQLDIDPRDVQTVGLATCAMEIALEERALSPVAAVRISEPPRSAAPPFHRWPAELAAVVGAPGDICRLEDLVEGSPLIERLRARGVRSIALTAQHAPSSPRAEFLAGAALRRLVRGCRITLSHSLGTVGLLARENATIINAALADRAGTVLDQWLDQLSAAGIHAPLYVSRYDGTVADADFIREQPVVILGGRRAAAARGAAVLSGVSEGNVLRPLERGFTLVELQGGYPSRSDQNLAVEGIQTSLPEMLVRRVETVQPWERFGYDDQLLLREASAATGYAGPLVVMAARPRVIDPASSPRRRLLPEGDSGTVTALGAASAAVGADSDALTRGGDHSGEQSVVVEAMVRAVASGARRDSVRLLALERLPVSNVHPGQTSHRVHARVLGTPVGSAQ